MGVFVALAVGYVVGARAGSKDLDQVGKALKSLSASDEFADVVSAVRSHLGHTLRELAGDDRGRPRQQIETGDLVERVRHLFPRTEPASRSPAGAVDSGRSRAARCR